MLNTSNNLWDMTPEYLNQWFPIEQQRKYVSRLINEFDMNRRRFGITRRRAEYFVRLWAYLLLKQQQEQGQNVRHPLTQLHLPDGFIPCTLREAEAIFYSDKERGTERAAGMMLDRLVSLGLIKKDFDGNTICIQILSQPELTESPKVVEPVEIKVDDFDPETDAIPVATFLASNYKWMNKNTAAPYKIARLLRDWAEQYPIGMRVLRHYETLYPVGFYVFYATAKASEKNFFLAPSKSLHLSSANEIDPIKRAMPGDGNCTSIFVRSWMIENHYMQQEHVCKFLEDTKKTMTRMQADFPNLCDMYSLIIHPRYEKLSEALRFQKIGQDSQLPVYWVYKPIKKFLALDMEEAVSRLDLATSALEF